MRVLGLVKTIQQDLGVISGYAFEIQVIFSIISNFARKLNAYAPTRVKRHILMSCNTKLYRVSVTGYFPLMCI